MERTPFLAKVEKIAKKYRYTVALVGLLVAAIASLHLGGTGAPASVRDGQATNPMGPSFVVRVDVTPWPLESKGLHDVCFQVNNVGNQDGMIGRTEVRFERSDNSYIMKMGLKNLTRIGGDPKSLFVPAHAMAFFEGTYSFAEEPSGYWNFVLDVKPVYGNSLLDYGAGSDLSGCRSPEPVTRTGS